MRTILYKVIVCTIITFAINYQLIAQEIALPYYQACQNCSFLIEEKSLFYDDGGAAKSVSGNEQTTTFKADARRGKKLSFFFTKIDLPAGAYLMVHYRNFGEIDRDYEVFTSIEKTANIIADEITVEYVPFDNVNGSEGWEATIEVVDFTSGQVAGRPESDCVNAIPLCANQTVVALGGLYTDLGATNDDSGNCYSGTGSGGSVWYSFTPLTNGPLDFRITPTSGGTDYDFVIWDITNGCGSKSQVSCNYSLYTGQTGLSGQLCNTFEGDCFDDCTSQSKGASCNRYNNRVNVQSNRTYAICINFFSGSNGGFTLQFQNEPGSVAITDNKPPQVANAFASNCNSASSFRVEFTEYVQCNSILSNSFSLPGYNFTVTNTNCFDNRTKAIDIAVSPPLPPGQYTVAINGIVDLCNNTLNVNYFIDLTNPPTPSITNANPICRNPTPNGGFSNAPANQTITASGGTSYLWSTGQTSAGIQVNPANNTTYTVTAYRGACSATASRLVTVRRAAAVSLGPDKITCGSPVTLTASPASFNNYQFFRAPSQGPLVFNNGTSVQNGANASLSVSPATNTTYRVIVTDANGCKAQDDIKVIVTTDFNANILVTGNNFCRTGNPIPLDAVPPGGTFSGPGVSGNTFNPTAAGVGAHQILYEVTNSCGTYRDTITLNVKNGTAPTSGLAPTYCVTAPEVAFTPTPRCGIVSGPGITNPGACIIPTAYAQNPRFNPGQAGIGTHVLTITYNASSTGCTNTTTVTVLGAELPVVDDPGGPYCSSQPAFTLSASPLGGVFSGPGVIGNTFNPSVAGVGSHNVTYTINTCSGTSSDFKTIQVVAGSSNASISYAGTPFCRTIATPQQVTLTGTTGGTFSASPAGLTINAATGAITPSTSTVNNYTVTYNIPAAGGCPASTTTTTVSITNSITPTFNSVNPICSGGTAPVLPTTSTNNITGSWSPATVNNTTSGTYTFTPNPGQCAANTTLNVTVNPATTPVFNAIPAFCEGTAAPALPLTSTNNITGTWSPAAISNTTSGTYTFTPNAGQCATSTTLNVTVNPANLVPTFSPIGPICEGTAAPALPLTSTNNITGTWSPAAISNTTSGTYTFTPNAGQCATSTTLNVTVNPANLVPTFSPIGPICEGTAAPALPLTSTNNITGTWSPATISNTTSGTYTFTPDAGQCATSTTLNVTVNPANIVPAFSAIGPICEGTAAPALPLTSTNNITGTWSPATISNTTSGTYTFTPSAGQCASNTSLNVTVKPNSTTSVAAQICNGQSFTLPDGSSVNTAGIYPVTLASANGCDSIVTTNLAVISVLTTTIDTAICAGENYTLPDGSIVNAGGSYAVTLISSGNCDSIITTNLTVNPTFDVTVAVEICVGSNYTLPDGSIVSTAGQYPVVLTSVNGCDSTVTTNLTILPVFAVTVPASICTGDSFTLPDGSSVSTAGLYPVTLTASNSCDSVVTTDLTVNPIFNVSVDAQICNGQSFTLPDGSSVNTAGIYPVTLASANGCDSIVTTNLAVISVLTTTIDTAICAGENYTLPDGSIVSSGGSYAVTLVSSGNCDSIITTNLTVNPTFDITVAAEICSGSNFTLPDGTIVSTAGQYPVVLTSVNGCDSTVTTNLTILPVFAVTVPASICTGDSFTLPDGSSVSTAGLYPVTLTASNSCDSVVTTDLTVNPIFNVSVAAQICNGQSFTLPDGSSVNTAGIYPVTLASANGCDSIVTTNLAVISVLTTTIDTAICAGDSYTLPDGSIVSSGGSYAVTLVSSGNCDSIITTNLTVHPTFDITVAAEICAGSSYILPDGSSVSTAGQYPVVLASVNGCDSTVTTNLTILPVFAVTVPASICTGDSFTLPDGSSVSTAGLYPVTLTASNSCDSVVTTNLTVNPIFNVSVDAQICNGQSFTLPDGSSVNTAGLYPVTLASANGCDSVVTTNLAVISVLTTTIDTAICAGDSYTLPDGSIVSSGGSYAVTLVSSGNCDSIITTNLTVHPTFDITVAAEICAGRSYTLPDGSSVSTAGQYPVVLTSVNGCDSTVTTNLTILPVFAVTVPASICTGDSFTLPDGSSVSTAGLYPVTLTASNSCDSVVTTDLTVNPIFNISVDAQICNGQSYTLPDGSQVNTAGTYQAALSSIGGCDSNVTINLTVVSVLTTNIDASICQGESYTLPDGSIINTAGSFPVTLASITGCDSIVTTNLTVNNSFSSTVDTAICAGDVYILPDGSSVTNGGTYTTTLTASNSCDSVVTTNLTIINVASITINTQICTGQSYTLPDGSSVNTSGTYVTILTSSLNCDSTITTNLAVVSTLSSTVDAQICIGQSYTLPDGSTVSTSGTFVVTLPSSINCDSVVTTNLTVLSVLTTTVDASICQGESYLLPDGISVGTAGSYPVTLLSSGGCDSIVTTNLAVNVSVNITKDVSICEGDSYFAGGANQTQNGTYLDVFTASNGCDSIITTNLTVTNSLQTSLNVQICTGQTYILPDGSSVATSGSYPVTLTSAAGCDSIITTNLTVSQGFSVTINDTICEGISYVLPDGSSVSTSGIYPVVLQSTGGCDSTITTNLSVILLPTVSLGADTLICEGDSITLSANGQVGIWQDGSTASDYVATASGIYSVTVTNNCGETTDEVLITSESCLTCEVFLPNAFTPNQDGVNDKFTPIVTCEEVIPYLFRVYNRWNELVFETDIPGVGWDGIFEGKQQPTDAYVYYVSYFSIKQNKSLIQKGVVGLIR